MSRAQRRRAAREGRREPKVHLVSFMDDVEAARRLRACSCPVLIIPGDDFTTVEHYHAPGCPELAKIKRPGGEP